MFLDPCQPCKTHLTFGVMSSYLSIVRNDVRVLRSAKGLRQEDLAKAMNVSRQTINAIETGRYLPSLPLAIELARFFGKPVEELFHGEHDEH